MTESISPSLEALLSIVLDATADRCASDPEFAARLREAVDACAASKGGLTPLDPFNPLAILRGDGEGALRRRLARAMRAELTRVLAFHDLDPLEETRQMRVEALRDFIVERCRQRVARDKAFTWEAD